MGCFEIKLKNEYYRKVKEINKKNDLYRSFLLRSSETNNEYAYKYIDVSALNQGEKNKILNEIEYLKKIIHPNIIELKNAYYSDDNKFLNVITEYSEEGTLQMKLDQQKEKGQYFDGNTLINWFYQICLALEFIHNKKILHRDINPSNIFLMKDNFAKLGNFGLAKDFSPSLIRSTTMVTSQEYLAPEVIKDKSFKYETDIWALGVTFYQLIILDYPFEGKSIEEKYKNIEKGNIKPIPKDCKIDNQFIEIIAKMVLVRPEERLPLKEILDKSIIKQRIKCYLRENNFNHLETIKTLEQFDNEEDKKEKTIPVVIENDEEEKKESKESKEKKEKEIKEYKEKIVHYTLLRHMTLIEKIVKN